MSHDWKLDLGATYRGKGVTHFHVWAPHHRSLCVELEGRVIPMKKQEPGFFSCIAEKSAPGDSYFYLFENGEKRPDPVSRALPQGVHGPTVIVDKEFPWTDHDWKGIEKIQTILYEIHVGTFTPEGTFEGVIDKLDYLLDLGVTVIEIMPIAQFPGKWNWGYDGVSIYAPFSGYGGAEGMKRLVDAAHQKGMGVCLDVVYNHLGPIGNYLADFAPYFHTDFKTPWGEAFNYDGPQSDHVRHYIISNALYWAYEYHIDALRLDAVHGIFDFSAQQMLDQLAQKLPIPLIAECELNDSQLVRPKSVGGINLDAIWNDDFHHSAHVALTDEQQRYYSDYNGIKDLAKTIKEGFAYNGRYSEVRKKTYGNKAANVPYEKFIAYTQNHDQTGNRPLGERLSTLIKTPRLKCAPFLTLLSPFTPMLFMGEEYGEKVPFEYFVDFDDPKLMEEIFEGRKREFQASEMPFPGKESFQNSKLSWKQDPELFALYQKLISLRKKYPPKTGLAVGEVPIYHDAHSIAWEYPTEEGEWIGLYCYLGKGGRCTLPFKKVKKEKILLTTQKITLEDRFSAPCELSLVLI
ncbi:MAG: Malto-oligosyltrehalose trehalohydrolase [Chlamydiales bacterium]|nr:Malto-oligosyltrehalose trehalohydrolase [Chlamydiales bacterium]MCH9620283.1 Malto-oligosyltrehalose trehalohydrolase [Chlamydiales bacterium]MCH9622806.1 Malto-oligosyltrehalose trehalohydrolase [Chlamydiales bacterium]